MSSTTLSTIVARAEAAEARARAAKARLDQRVTRAQVRAMKMVERASSRVVGPSGFRGGISVKAGLNSYPHLKDNRTRVGASSRAGTGDFHFDGLTHDQARRQSQQLLRTNQIADAMVERLIDCVIGTGPKLLFRTSDKAWNAQAEAWWEGIGPTATSCMQRARMNVLVVRENHAGPFRSVVACLDFTETSKLALQQAIRVAAQDGAALHVLHVYDDPWYGLGPPSGVKAHMPDFKAQFSRGVLDRVREFCAPFSHELNALRAAFHCLESEWRGGGYGHAIVRFVKKQGCDLAILGTRDRWNIRDMVFGSTAERVVRGASCSILAVKPDLAA